MPRGGYVVGAVYTPLPMPDHPLAYFITWRTYGTWLAGDARGSTTHLRNTPGTPFVPPTPNLQAAVTASMRSEPFVLDRSRRQAAHEAIEEACYFRGWELLALSVRSNHVHVVVEAGKPPELVMSALKARATSAMRKSGLVPTEVRVWSRHGSTRYLWTEQSIERACYYVLHMQDEPQDTGS